MTKGKAFSSMIGGTFIYRNNEYTVKSIDDEGDEVKVVTVTGKVLRLSHAELREMFIPVNKNADGGNESHAVVLFDKMNMDLGTPALVTVLKDTIEKLKANKDFVDQARAINETAATMIDLGRLQVEMIRALKH